MFYSSVKKDLFIYTTGSISSLKKSRKFIFTEQLYYVKDILPQNEHFLKYFLALCSPVNLLKHNIKCCV